MPESGWVVGSTVNGDDAGVVVVPQPARAVAWDDLSIELRFSGGGVLYTAGVDAWFGLTGEGVCLEEYRPE